MGKLIKNGVVYTNAIAVDTELSTSSTNAVQNKVITTAINTKQDATDNTLTTTSKTITGAINELDSDVSSLSNDKQPKTMSQTIAGQTNVESCLSTLNTSLSTKGVYDIGNGYIQYADGTQICYGHVYPSSTYNVGGPWIPVEIDVTANGKFAKSFNADPWVICSCSSLNVNSTFLNCSHNKNGITTISVCRNSGSDPILYGASVHYVAFGRWKS